MCLYPKIILNKKYTVTKKNKGAVPVITDERARYVPLGCGKCIECRKQKARAWKIRLFEAIKTRPAGLTFVTLTFSPAELDKLTTEIYGDDKLIDYNEVATLAIRRFLERWRKKFGQSIKHWCITELGHKGTERIHLHGIIWTKDTVNIRNIWKYGWVYCGLYVSEQTINYISKYITKVDLKHPDFTGKILCSKGIGAEYINTHRAKENKFQDDKTNDMYKDLSGRKTPLNTYYRNKIYSDEEREKLWLNRLDKEERYVLGKRIDLTNPDAEKNYNKALKFARIKNKMLGYKGTSWNAEKYKKDREKLTKK